MAWCRQIGEGFKIVEEKSDFDFDLAEVARVWNHGSVIRSWLMEIAGNSNLEVVQVLGRLSWKVAAFWGSQMGVENGFKRLGIPQLPTIALSFVMRTYQQEEDNFSVKSGFCIAQGFGGTKVVKKDFKRSFKMSQNINIANCSIQG